MIRYMIVVFMVALLSTLWSIKALAWDHAVIMKPHEGATYSVPIPLTPGFPNCVYISVTDCKNAVLDPDAPDIPPTNTLTPPAPPVVSEIPSPIGAYGWSFYNPIDRTEWAAYADDEEPNGGSNFKAMAAIDDDPVTQWHTTWSADVDPLLPHHIVIDMGTEHWVDSLIYSPRVYEPDKSWSANGNILNYEVWVSNNYTRTVADDGTVTENGVWGRVASGTFPYDEPNQTNTAIFSVPNFVRYVKLVALTADGNSDINKLSFANAGDIKITESTKDIVITGGGVN